MNPLSIMFYAIIFIVTFEHFPSVYSEAAILDKYALPYKSINQDKYELLTPKSIHIYQLIEKYANEYNVPLTVALNVALLETGYKGPTHKDYNNVQTSYANAYGVMQLLLSTARDMYEGDKKSLTSEMLLYDYELNIKLGCKYLRYLHNIYKDWTIVCGFYNTGYPKINDYALSATKYINK